MEIIVFLYPLPKSKLDMASLREKKIISAKDYLVKPNSKVKLSRFSTKCDNKLLAKDTSAALLYESREHLAKIQDMLYAHRKYSVLLIFQALDAAGKDGAIKHIMTGFNPQGVRVYSFKAPNNRELDHDYLWRHMRTLPARGEIVIHNRSHYENVLATRVHPDWIMKESIPDIDGVKDIDDKFWKMRFKQIRRFEKTLAENGMLIMKFFLHVSKKEQKKRLIERIDNPAKNWKFSLDDLKERAHWEDYQKAYEEALSATSADYAPWYVIPADDKWFTRLAIASIISREFDKLKINYPQVSEQQKAELQKAKALLEAERHGF